MNAHRLFKKGARVCVAPEVTATFFDRYRPLTGTITGFSRDAESVWVRWDGYKTAMALWVGFLVSEENARREAVPPSEPVTVDFNL